MTGYTDIFGKTLARYTFLRRDQYEVSDKILLREFLFRGGDLGNQSGDSDTRLDLASLDLAYEVWKHQFIPGGGAHQRDILNIHVAHVEMYNRAGDGDQENRSFRSSSSSVT